MRRFPSFEDPPVSDMERNIEFAPLWEFTTKDNLSPHSSVAKHPSENQRAKNKSI